MKLSLLFSLLLVSSSLQSAEVSKQVDETLQARDTAAVPLVGKARRDAATSNLEDARVLRDRVTDKAWVIFSLDSLRRAGTSDSTAWYELYDQALVKLQGALSLTGDRYPGEMNPAELAALRENLRTQAASGYLEVLDLLEQALKANPWDDSILEAISGVLDDLGRLYASLDYRERAIQVGYKRLAVDASNYLVHWDLADLLKGTQRKRESLERYQVACERLREYAWEDDGGTADRPVGRRRDHLAMLLRERINLAMELQDESAFRSAVAEWQPLASPSEAKEIAELGKWLGRGGGNLGQAMRIDRAWKLIEQGREIEARELLIKAVEESADARTRALNQMSLAELEFYRLELKDVAIERIRKSLSAELPAEDHAKAVELRAGMLLDLGSSIEQDDPSRAWNLYHEAMDDPAGSEVELCMRLGNLMLNRPSEALIWLERAQKVCLSKGCDTAEERDLQRLLALAYRRLDRPADARQAIERARELER
jgi:tetratricopeptide (TPR) repeat protein